MPENEMYSQSAARWNIPGYEFIGSSPEAITTMMTDEKTQVRAESFFGEHICEGIAIVKDWIRNPEG